MGNEPFFSEFIARLVLHEVVKVSQRENYHHGDLRTALLEMAAEMIAAEGLESVTLRALSR